MNETEAINLAADIESCIDDLINEPDLVNCSFEINYKDNFYQLTIERLDE